MFFIHSLSIKPEPLFNYLVKTVRTIDIDNQLLLAESKLYRVTLLDFGCKFGVCLSVIPENALRSSLAEFCFDKEVNRIFDAIASYYNVITDNCYWTSAKRLMPSLFHRPQQPFLAEQKFA